MRPHVIHNPFGSEIAESKTVAVVGNASSALTPADPVQARKIDEAELVLRMNAGVPGPEQRGALGTRTDILSVGNIAVLKDSLGRLEKAPREIWFVKPTTLGNKEWGRLAAGEVTLPCPIWRFPVERIKKFAEALGSPPSGGACVIFHLLGYVKLPQHIRLYGFDWFASPTWWHGERPEAKIIKRGPTHDHDGANERRFFTERGVVAR